MKQMNSLLDILSINSEKTSVIAVVGGGGKTSLIYRLTEELVSCGKKVIVTTTTHMAYEPERPFAENGNVRQIDQNLTVYGYTVAATLDPAAGKIAGLSEKKTEQLKELSDVLLIEADGAKRLPLKIPAEWEPVIPDFADMIIGVIGMDAVEKPLDEICHRPERMAEFLGKKMTDLITVEDILDIAVSENGLKKNVRQREYRVFLNKTDLPGKLEQAEKVVEQMNKQRITAGFGSLQRREYYR